MGINFCGKHPLLMTRIRVSDPGSKGQLVYLSSQFYIVLSYFPVIHLLLKSHPIISHDELG